MKMLTTYLTKRWAGGSNNPSKDDLLEALEELKTPDREHPDCWLSDQDNLTISAFENGLVVLENPETDDGPWHIKSVTHDLVMSLWQHLQKGEIDQIKKYPWLKGYK